MDKSISDLISSQQKFISSRVQYFIGLLKTIVQVTNIETICWLQSFNYVISRSRELQNPYLHRYDVISYLHTSEDMELRHEIHIFTAFCRHGA